jgi:hypothetical protein
MRVYSTAITNYRAAGKAFWPIHFISFLVKDVDNPALLFRMNYCTADDDMTVTITDPDNGAADERTFAGGGHIIKMGDLVRSEGAVIRTHSFTMSGASTLVQDMIHGYNCREALFQGFVGEVDQDTGLLIDEPPCELVGFVNTINFSESALVVGGTDSSESLVNISVDSLAAALTDRNYDMRDDEVGKTRDGDRFFKYADSAHHWNIRWGKGKKREKDKSGKGGGKNKGGGKGGSTAGGTGRTRPDR